MEEGKVVLQVCKLEKKGEGKKGGWVLFRGTSVKGGGEEWLLIG